jgi:hypothetical protein
MFDSRMRCRVKGIALINLFLCIIKFPKLHLKFLWRKATYFVPIIAFIGFSPFLGPSDQLLIEEIEWIYAYFQPRCAHNHLCLKLADQFGLTITRFRVETHELAFELPASLFVMSKLIHLKGFRTKSSVCCLTVHRAGRWIFWRPTWSFPRWSKFSPFQFRNFGLNIVDIKAQTHKIL